MSEVATFDNKSKRTELGDMEAHEKMLAATRALVRELRIQLQRSGRYTGSKLELIDLFDVKMSELSLWPIYLVRWKLDLAKVLKVKTPGRPAKKKKKEEKIREPVEEGKRSSRTRQETKKYKDFIL